MVRKIIRWMAIVLIAVLAVLVAAQTASAQDPPRKIRSKVTPVYPELARRMNVSGKVKVELTVEPNGSVKTAKALGGSPLLIEPAVDAARKWKFEPGKSESTTIVEFNFNPTS